MNCFLCGTNRADKKNSHVIPFFLIKSMVTPTESRRTEKDISFDLSKLGIVQCYFGRDVSPETINETLGREMGKKDLEENVNPYTKDDFLCTERETKIARLESKFSSIVYPKIFAEKRQKEDESYEPIEVDTLITLLFCYSIIWRIGSSGFGNLQIHQSILKTLAGILNLILATDEKDLERNLLTNKDKLLQHKIALSVDTRQEYKDGRFVFFKPDQVHPHSFYINSFYIAFYYKRSMLNNKGSNFLGLNRQFNRVKIRDSQNIQVYYPSPERVANAVKEILAVTSKRMSFYLASNFKAIFNHIYKVDPPADLVSKYMSELIFADHPPADRYSMGRIAELTAKYCNVKLEKN